MDTRTYLSNAQEQWQEHNLADDNQVVDEVGSSANNTPNQTGRRRPPFGIPLKTGTPVDGWWASINEQLLVAKIFYFFFYSAFGSLFPLMGVYFKQLGMDAVQAGTLIGVRPFIEILSAPFWSAMAERFRKSKIMLLFSLFCWIVFTLSLAFIRPPASACVIFNETHHVLYTPYSNDEIEVDENVVRERRSIMADDQFSAFDHEFDSEDDDESAMLFEQLHLKRSFIDSLDSNLHGGGAVPIERFLVSGSQSRVKREDEDQTQIIEARPTDEEYVEKPIPTKNPKSRHRPPPGYVVGKSPMTVEYTLNYDKEKHISYVSPPFSTIVYKWEDVKEVFFLLLLLVCLGEFFSAPAITIADSATLNALGENIDQYHRQRMFGSVGWGITMFLVGMALDGAISIPDHPCGPHERERNYVVCFTIFSVLMGCALLVATQFNFEFEDVSGLNREPSLKPYNENGPGPRPIFNTADPINKPPEDDKKFELLDKWKSAVFAQRQRGLPEWIGVVKQVANMKYATFLLTGFFMGFGIGMVFTFLFWHLQDIGGTPTLFGYASVINHISEILAYFFSLPLIKQFGHKKVLCFGLICNIFRFTYVAFLWNAWWVLPFELVQGVTHAAVWAALCSYVTQVAPSNLRQSTQGVLQALHNGIGRGLGSILGGLLVNAMGSRFAFFVYGLLSMVVLAIFVYTHCYIKGQGLNFIDEMGDEIVLEETGALAPHGVPSAPITRSLSRSNIQQEQHQQQQQQQPSQQDWGDTNTGYGTTSAYSQPDTWGDPNAAWGDPSGGGF